MSENDWTARFVDCLGNYFQACDLQKHEAHDTTGAGIGFESFQQKFSCIQGLSPIYMFHGSPDVLIKTKNDVVPLALHYHRAIEMAPTAKDHSAIPEKMGELASSMYWLLVTNVIKRIVAGCDVSCVSTKGLLIDKMLESGIHCEAQAKVCDVNDNDLREAQFSIVTSQPYCGRLNPAWLCFHLNKLVEL